VKADLSRVIEAADAIDHAMPLPEEIEHAARVLVPDGLLRMSDDQYELTPQGRELCERADTDDAVATTGRLLRLLREASSSQDGG
jgi:hypothetical protein